MFDPRWNMTMDNQRPREMTQEAEQQQNQNQKHPPSSLNPEGRCTIFANYLVAVDPLLFGGWVENTIISQKVKV